MLKWLDNFWYHNKWKVIIALFFIVVVVICTVQLATRKKYDAQIIFVGNGGAIDGVEYNDILKTFEGITPDADGNGKINVNFSRETYLKSTDEMSSALNSNITSFMATARLGDYFIFFIDPSLYDIYKESGMFVTLEDKIGEIPYEMKYDECAIRLDKCKFYDMAGISAIQSDALIVLKEVPQTIGTKKSAEMEALQSVHAEIIKKIVSYGVR